jgi:hypothetical protein
MASDDLSFEEITAYFSKAGASSHCPTCRSQQWIIPPQPHQRTIGLFAPRLEDGGYISPGTIIPTIIVVCTNCGFTRLHSLAVLWEKIRGQPLFPEAKNG